LAYQFKINDVSFYAAQLPTWLSRGQPNFLPGGLPSPYQPGEFSVTLNAVAIQDPTPLGGDFATSGTYQELFNIWVTAQDTTDGVVWVNVLDPRTNIYSAVSARMKPPLGLAGGAAISGVTVEFYSAFIPDSLRATYYGGDPDPITDAPPYIPGDPLPTPTPGTFGWNIGEWDDELWNEGA
jgi:hypothetical protein